MLFKAGIYYVGDPCYVIRGDEWEDILSHTNYFNCNTINQWGGDWKGHQMFVAGTAYGDGEYRDSEGRTYGVDAGLIGIVTYEYITDFSSIWGGNVIEFKNDFDVDASEGKFTFGHLTIDTCGEDEDEICLGCGNYDYECQCEEE